MSPGCGIEAPGDTEQCEGGGFSVVILRLFFLSEEAAWCSVLS